MEGNKALHFRKLEDGTVQCLLCPNLCRIGDGRTGKCGLRKNEKGELYTLSYGRTVTLSMDPIEKKPLYHFMPGSSILSIGPNGCTFRCDNCQNWNISQEKAPTRFIDPGDLVDIAGKDGSIGVAFTYTEPLLFFEYLKDVAPMLRGRGLKSVLVTNGYLEEGPTDEIVPLIDGFNVDLKSMSDDFYRKYCGGGVEPVKRFIERASSASHVEVTNLVIPGLNDSVEELEEMASWLAGISSEIPLHLSRFFPHYRMADRPPTPGGKLEEAYAIAKKHLDHVYVGNIFIEGAGDTYCRECGEVLIRRSGYRTRILGAGGTCRRCGTMTRGVWS